MKKMTIMCMAALLLMAVSCKKEPETYSDKGFQATTESHTGEGDSKTQLNGNLSVTWCSSDLIKVFSSTDSQGKKFSAASAGTKSDFNPVDAVTDAFFSPTYTAFYPYDAVTGINQISLKGTQHYTTFDDGNGNDVLTFASGENPMAAQSNSNVLSFKNLCGILKFQFYSESTCDVKKLCVTSLKPGEQLCGKGVVTFNGANATLGTLTSGGASIILNCNPVVRLSDNPSNPTIFYVVIPGGALTEGFTVTVTDENDNVWSKTTTANNMITKSKIKAMPPTEVGETHTPVTPSVTVMTGCQSYNTYAIGGSVTVPTGPHACEVGLVYSDSDHMPTIDGGAQKVVLHTMSEPAISGTQFFEADLGALTPGTTYYVRAYAMCEGLAYSSVVTVVGGEGPKPLPSNWNNGKNPHPFTVGPGKVVYFSQGNLQYIGSAASPYWKFADHQFDFFGNNGQESASTTVNRDLFGWGTSGWDNGNQSYQPYATDKGNNMSGIGYGYGPTDGNNQYLLDLTGDYANADWGVYNTITNGVGSNWRTLTGGTSGGEWYYLIGFPTGFASRTNSQQLYGEGKVGNCTEGLIILPDDWYENEDRPSLSFTPGRSAWANSYSYSEWSLMEAAGAVFLPVAGCRIGAGEHAVAYTSGAYYWSSTHCDSGNAYTLNFSKSNVGAYANYNRYCGCSVRLVSDTPPTTK